MIQFSCQQGGKRAGGKASNPLARLFAGEHQFHIRFFNNQEDRAK